MSRLDELLKTSVNLSEVISKDTEPKTPGRTSMNDFEQEHEQNDDFEPEVIREIEDEPELEEEEPYDAKANARALVGGLLGIDTTIFSIVSVLKAKKSVGGKEAISQMKAAYIKKANGQPLSEEEAARVEAFEVYKKDIEMMESDYIPNQKRMEMLVNLAEPWCEENKIKVSHGMAFWANYVGYTVERVAKIMMK